MRRKREWKDKVMYVLIGLSAAITVLLLGVIVVFILYRGLPGVNLHFLTAMWEDKTTFVDAEPDAGADPAEESGTRTIIRALGIEAEKNEDGNLVICKINRASPVRRSRNRKNEIYSLKKGDVITKLGDTGTEGVDAGQINRILENGGVIRLKVVRPGGGIVPMLAATLYLIALSLLIAVPIGVCAAVYLNEYAKPGRLVNLIRFAVRNLAGIPSIIYGLFGMLFFVRMLNMQYSILAGAFTISMILLPVMISSTEEALRAIPAAYRESSFGLGATRLKTTMRVVLPNAMPGITTAILLSIGRIIGESAALLLTAGTAAQIPKALVGSEAGGSTLTVKLYWMLKETADIDGACSIAVVLLVLVVLLNFLSKAVAKRFGIRKQNG